LLTDALDADDLLDDDDDEDDVHRKSIGSQLSHDYSNGGDNGRYVQIFVILLTSIS